MQISDDKVVAIDYTLKDDGGEVLDSSEGRGPLSYLHGHGNIIPGLEKELTGKAKGDELDVTVEAEEAYGPRHDGLIQQVPMTAFDGVPEVKPGMEFQAQTDQGPMVVRVTDVEGDQVTVDGNHPLAGERLHFSVAVSDVRDATSQELEHGHVHQDGEDH